MNPLLRLCLLLLPLLLPAAEQPEIEQLFNVRTVKVEASRAALQQTNYGYVHADESRTVDVAPRFGGYVQTLYADTRYRRVKKGEALAQVYSPEVLQAKEDYLTALRFNETRPSKAMLHSLRRKLNLLGVGTDEIDTVRKTMKADALTTLRAPASGWIFKKNVSEGSAFKAGMTLFTVVNLDRVWVEAALYQRELPRLDTLTNFTVRATGSTKTYRAVKELLYPSLDPKAATATLRLAVDTPDNTLLPGMYVTVTAASKAAPVLTLPRSAVIRKNGAWYVFRTGDFKGIFDPVKVDVRPLDAKRVEVLSGLAEGDEVAEGALFMMDADAQLDGLY